MKKAYTIFATDDRGLIRRATGYTWDTIEGAQNFLENIPGVQTNYFVAETEKQIDAEKLRRQVRDALNKTRSTSKIQACAKILEI
jgi:membrane protease subunit (stomatin/prohibitin family)